MGVMQHHDAVTGTEKQHVASDYARMLNLGVSACSANTKSALNQFVTGKAPPPHDKSRAHSAPDPWDFKFSSCLNLNISVCDVTENSEQFTVTVYNPLAHATYQYVRVPVAGSKYEVRDYRNILVPSQLIAVADAVKDLEFRASQADHELVFQATEVPALGYKSYFVSRAINEIQPQVVQIVNRQKRKPDPIVIGNEFLNITFDGKFRHGARITLVYGLLTRGFYIRSERAAVGDCRRRSHEQNLAELCLLQRRNRKQRKL